MSKTLGCLTAGQVGLNRCLSTSFRHVNWRGVKLCDERMNHTKFSERLAMETLVFETALGHIAFARMAGLARHDDAGPAAVRRWGPLLALSFGHASQQAALRALAHTLARVGQTNPAPACRSQSRRSQATSVDLGIVCPDGDELVDRIGAYALGDADSFDDVEIDASGLTPFGRKVTAACRQIAWGETLSYGELAKRAGRPGAARAVGSVMARNCIPLIVPCHRVVPAAGGLGGFSAPQGVAMKQRLLEMEKRVAVLSK